MRLFFSFLLCCISLALFAQRAENIELSSPDGQNKVRILLGNDIRLVIYRKDKEVLRTGPLGLVLADGTVLGNNTQTERRDELEGNRSIRPQIYKKSEMKDSYREWRFLFKDKWALDVRAYDQGISYRYRTLLAEDITIQQEKLSLIWKNPGLAYASQTDTWQTAYETFYNTDSLHKLPQQNILLPFALRTEAAIATVMEADLYDYPAMQLLPEGAQTLQGAWAKVPKTTAPGGHNQFVQTVTETHPYIAQTAGRRSFPWRIIALADEDKDLLDNDLVYLLSRPATTDFSWAKPGKVAWDWWHANRLWGVDFQSGMNTATYKAYIDFAARNGLDYINLDEGWSDQFDLFKIHPDINLPDILAYARSKNVGVILWCIARTLDRQMEPFMQQCREWGVAGLKVDFMDRDDQEMIRFYERAARTAAANRLALNFHGACKPFGLQRAYPNILNHEAVRGMEWNKFNPEGSTPDHAATIPFVRMQAGFLDYTPGAMHNYNRQDWKQVFDRPGSMGTRCQQLAMYVLYEQPLAMLSDVPMLYEQDTVCLNYLKNVPTTWDETRALDGHIGEYAVIARRKGDTWYIAALTNWSPRTIRLDLSCLSEGTSYQARIYRDGPNAAAIGEDYVLEQKTLNAADSLEVQLAPGGGVVLVLK